MVSEVSTAEKSSLMAVGRKLPNSLHWLKNDKVHLNEVLIEFTFSFHLFFSDLTATCKASPVSTLTSFRAQKKLVLDFGGWGTALKNSLSSMFWEFETRLIWPVQSLENRHQVLCFTA